MQSRVPAPTTVPAPVPFSPAPVVPQLLSTVPVNIFLFVETLINPVPTVAKTVGKWQYNSNHLTKSYGLVCLLSNLYSSLLFITLHL